MPRNHLKHFPTAMLRRGMVHFHPVAWPSGRDPAAVRETPAPAGSADRATGTPATAWRGAARAGSRTLPEAPPP